MNWLDEVARKGGFLRGAGTRADGEEELAEEGSGSDVGRAPTVRIRQPAGWVEEGF